MIEPNPNWHPYDDDAEFDARCKGSEDAEQMALMAWAARAMYHGKWPELKLLHHIPNGGERSVVVATKLKAMGTKPGVPDLFLPVARHGVHGLYIELKKDWKFGGGKASAVQLEWRDALIDCGYGWALAQGWKEARETLIQYLSEPAPAP
ncbi:MAG: VRR-NUC domain-containing protein [Acholeplasmataceae bacterium]|nr:VRR-NUC domain-containing protein [Acholeplasmataceae bacterium]